MDKEFIKGLLMLFGGVLVLLTIFFLVSDNATDKAKCIADALKGGVPVANIDRACKLTETRPGR